jgi:aminoglycoside phosphotransferase (APT) family kinase protein
MTKMHEDELEIDEALVERLVSTQFPQWAGLAIEPVFPRGTDNALYRLGTDKVVRLPRREIDTARLAKERVWLPRVARHVPVAVPQPLADGAPMDGYPLIWSVYSWLDGRAATAENVGDPLARDLARFILALQRIDPAGGPGPGEHNALRGEPLVQRDRLTRASIAALGRSDLIASWEDALAAPEWSGEPVWIHGDLDSRNLLVDDQGRLSGVIDFGCLGVGDPACDVMAAWKLFTAESRDLFRHELAVDDATWARARGWTLSQAVMALSYYTPETNAVLVHEAERWLGELFA